MCHVSLGSFTRAIKSVSRAASYFFSYNTPTSFYIRKRASPHLDVPSSQDCRREGLWLFSLLRRRLKRLIFSNIQTSPRSLHGESKQSVLFLHVLLLQKPIYNDPWLWPPSLPRSWAIQKLWKIARLFRLRRGETADVAASLWTREKWTQPLIMTLGRPV
jgi:hypothetical protein